MPHEIARILPLPSIVLLIDARTETREQYSAHFEASGLWVAMARDPIEGLETALELKPDLVVIGHTEVDHFARTLRANPVTRQVPIIVLRDGRLADVPQSIRTLADVWLEEPTSPAALLETSRTLLRRSRGTAPARARGDISLVHRTYTRDGGSAETRRRCPACGHALEWIERGRLGGIEYDYYRWCANRCGLYCYERTASQWVRLA